MKRMLVISGLVAIAAMGTIFTSYAIEKNHHATCKGARYCNACKTCNYCGHCAKNGGSCGVCR